MENDIGMISALKRRLSRGGRQARGPVARDPSTRFAYELATKPPTKDVASVKAASDLFDASRRKEEAEAEPAVGSGRSINDAY